MINAMYKEVEIMMKDG